MYKILFYMKINLISIYYKIIYKQVKAANTHPTTALGYFILSQAASIPP